MTEDPKVHLDPAFAARQVNIETREGGTLILRSPVPIGTIEPSVCVYLRQWSKQAPTRIFLAQPRQHGDWETIEYQLMWQRVGSVGQALLERGLTKGDKIAILSGNSIEHAIVTFAAMSVGLVVSPISPNYSLLEGGLVRLREIAKVLKPSLVFAQDARAFARARTVAGFADVDWLSAIKSPNAALLEDLYATQPGDAFAKAFAATDPDAPAKILFTSGSTGTPKGVVNTNRMMASSVAMGANLASVAEPPVQLDWLPWHHTMGGNATLNGILKNGGTLYIDDGRPTPEMFGKTLANLRTLSPTSMLNVPLGYEMLVDALTDDEALRISFFRKLQRMSYAGAAIPRVTLERLQHLAVATVGRQIPVMSGYGTTETAPGICATYWPSEQSGEIGLPLPGIELKLVPIRDLYEVRVRGPNVMGGYLGRPDETAAAFDDEGFYCVGDTVTFMNPADPTRGLRFHGRLSESFKLTNGSWVAAGELRLKLLNATEGILQDLVIAGENRDCIAVMGWINPERSRQLVGDPQSLSEPSRLPDHAQLCKHLRQLFEVHNAKVTSSERVAAFALLHELPSLAAGETTDKGYINQRAVLANRADIVDDLYSDAPSAAIVVAPKLRRTSVS
jgi:feruloyl-CoA synthase